MTRVVETVAPEFQEFLTWEKVVTKDPEGAARFKEYCQAQGKLVPVPSIIIEGTLVFEKTPGVEALRDCIRGFINNPPHPS